MKPDDSQGKRRIKVEEGWTVTRSAHHSPIEASLRIARLEKCPTCGAEVNASLRHCSACQTDFGYPNVRAASVSKEADALATRFEDARKSADSRGLLVDFDGLVSEVDSASFVLVAVPPLVARNLFVDPTTLYAGYEDLVGAGIRAPAQPEFDTERFSVAGKLFGSYAGKIRYGVLALTDSGLPNYGSVFLRLRDRAVQHRVTFLHQNSYLFLQSHDVSATDHIPLGFKSTWSSRSLLVGAKLEPTLKPGSGAADWAKMLVAPGASRPEDRFVEAHIYGSFTAESVHSVSHLSTGASRADRNDFAVIEELITKRGSVGEEN